VVAAGAWVGAEACGADADEPLAVL